MTLYRPYPDRVPPDPSRHEMLVFDSPADGSEQRMDVHSSPATAPICEHNHTYSHGVTEFTQAVCWQLHEWSDYELALRWLLIHRRAPEV